MIFEVVEARVDGRGRKHQDFCFDAFLNDVFEQCGIAVIFVIRAAVKLAAIAEIMGFINDDEIVSVPAQTGEVGAVGVAAFAAQIGVIENFVIESIFGQGVVDVIVAIRVPIVGEFFGAEDEDIFVARFVILHNGQGGESFAEADRVGEDAAVVFFELIDDGEGGIALEMIEHVPDFAFFESGILVGQCVL